jgi:hypothetical protein
VPAGFDGSLYSLVGAGGRGRGEVVGGVRRDGSRSGRRRLKPRRRGAVSFSFSSFVVVGFVVVGKWFGRSVAAVFVAMGFVGLPVEIRKTVWSTAVLNGFIAVGRRSGRRRSQSQQQHRELLSPVDDGSTGVLVAASFFVADRG